MDQLLVDLLCRQNPRVWEQTITRHEAVDAYLALSGSGVRAVRDCASEIGVDARTFYRMVAMRRPKPSGRGRPPRQGNVGTRTTKSRASLGPHLEEIISMAFERVTRPCQLSDVQAEVLRLSHERNISPPARGTVRGRFRDATNGNIQSANISSWILDSCTLAVDLKGPEGAIAPAVLVALVQPSMRQVLLHGLFCGQPSQMEINKLFNDLDTTSAGSRIPGSIIASSAFRYHSDQLAALLRQIGVTLTAPALSSRGAANPTIGGEAIRNVVGSQLGKIAIRTRRARGELSDPVVTLETARTVVASLIERLNGCQA